VFPVDILSVSSLLDFPYRKEYELQKNFRFCAAQDCFASLAMPWPIKPTVIARSVSDEAIQSSPGSGLLRLRPQ
jgi:hypothetical protein